MFSPLEQFQINWYLRIYNFFVDFTISNVTLYLFYSLLIIILIIIIFNIDNNILSNRYQTFFIILNNLILKQMIEVLTNKGLKYMPLLYSFFYFILINNLISILPYSYCVTSQIILTLTLSLIVWFGVTFLGFSIHGFHFLSLFVPHNIPLFILPLIVLIEIISYFARIFSLAIRLAANLLSGHSLLFIVSSFGWKLHFIFLLFPLLFLFFLFALEFGVAFIQAAVFTLLTATYIKDALFLH